MEGDSMEGDSMEGDSMVKEAYPTKLTVKKCMCGHVGCNMWGFEEGTFYQGAGFSERVAKEVARRYNNYKYKKKGKSYE